VAEECSELSCCAAAELDSCWFRCTKNNPHTLCTMPHGSTSVVLLVAACALHRSSFAAHRILAAVLFIQLLAHCVSCRQHTCDQDSSSSIVQQPAPVICQGASLVLPSPPARQRSKQLQEHLAKLQDKVRDKA
jgi:hypothetical protein